MKESVISLSRPLESSIKVIGERRSQPAPVIRVRCRRIPINGIRAAIPVTSPEGNSHWVIKGRVVVQRLKEGHALRALGGRVQVHNRKGVTPHGHRRQEQPVSEMRRRLFEGVLARQEDANMIGPNGRSRPDVGPKMGVPWFAVGFLQTNDVSGEGMEVVKELAALVSLAKPFTVEGNYR
jgi:hypothetical protein